MNWLNLQVSVIRAPEYIGSEPTARATWFNVLAYSAESENSGRINGARQWKDRQWQQTCGVMLSEVEACAPLLTWDGDDLVIWGYPNEKEQEVRQMRELGKTTSARKAEAARLNGAKGGKPKTEPNDNPTAEPNDNPTKTTQTNPTGTHRREGKGKEIEGKENGMGAADAPPERERRIMPLLSEAMAYAPQVGITPSVAECWWQDCEARPLAPNGAFTNRDGTEIRNWQASLTSYGRKWVANEAQKKQQGSKPPSRSEADIASARTYTETKL